jgi:hypothetical protein
MLGQRYIINRGGVTSIEDAGLVLDKSLIKKLNQGEWYISTLHHEGTSYEVKHTNDFNEELLFIKPYIQRPRVCVLAMCCGMFGYHNPRYESIFRCARHCIGLTENCILKVFVKEPLIIPEYIRLFLDWNYTITVDGEKIFVKDDGFVNNAELRRVLNENCTWKRAWLEYDKKYKITVMVTASIIYIRPDVKVINPCCNGPVYGYHNTLYEKIFRCLPHCQKLSINHIIQTIIILP